MADAILGHRRIVGKPMPSAFNTTSTANILLASTNLTTATLVEGLVQHDYVDADVQVTILATIDETGSAALGDILAALEGHPKPAGAVFAMVSAGIIQCESGIVDANSRLSRRHLDHAGADRDAGEGGPISSLGECEGAGSRFNDAEAVHAPDVREISIPTIYVPAVLSVPGVDRASLRHEPLLDRPGIYAAIWGNEVYVGASKTVVTRLTKGRHLIAPRPADRILAIVDRTDQLTWDGAQVAERLLYRKVTASSALKARNEEPSGGQVDATTYKLVHDFVETAVVALSRAGLLSALDEGNGTPPSGPGIRDLTSIFSTRVKPPLLSASLYRLEACGVAARARVEGKSWTLLAGSQVRGSVMPSAHPSAQQRRIELLHSGGLVKKGRDYLLTEDLSFGSATGAAHFVVGSKTSVDIWQAESTLTERPLTH